MNARDYIDKVCDYTKRRGITLLRLAVESGYSEASMYNWKNGRRCPSLQAFLDLCEAADMELLLVPKDDKKLINEGTEETYQIEQPRY